MGGLTALRLCDVSAPGFAAALRGAPLATLSLNYWTNNEAYMHCDWAAMDLPSLSRLELSGGRGVDVLGDFAAARLPELRGAELTIGEQPSVDGARAFASAAFASAAFPLLDELSLTVNDTRLDGAVLKVLSRDVVPHLEIFRLSCGQRNEASAAVSAVAHSFLPAPGGPPRWPRLRSLDLHIYARPGDRGRVQHQLLVALASAAPHCPNLAHLAVSAGARVEKPAMAAFLSAARAEAQSWQLLRVLRMRYCAPRREKRVLKEQAREIWPQLKFDISPSGIDSSVILAVSQRSSL